MNIHWNLVRFCWARTLPVTLVAIPVSVLYALFAGQWLRQNYSWICMFILAHSILLAWRLGWPPRGERSFLYSRGFSRDTLWGHTMFATLLAVLAVWLPASLTLWTGLRSLVQDRVMHSPYFPLMAPVEAPVPLFWLAGYFGLMPLFHYAWIRAAAPERGRAAGVLLSAWLLIGLSIFASIGGVPSLFLTAWFPVAVNVLGVAMVLLLFGLSRRLHRVIEVGE